MKNKVNILKNYTRLHVGIILNFGINLTKLLSSQALAAGFVQSFTNVRSYSLCILISRVSKLVTSDQQYGKQIGAGIFIEKTDDLLEIDTEEVKLASSKIPVRPLTSKFSLKRLADMELQMKATLSQLNKIDRQKKIKILTLEPIEAKIKKNIKQKYDFGK